MEPLARETIDADRVLRNAVAWGDARPDVRAMLLTSTRTIPDAVVDRFSDYDIILVVTDVRPLFGDRSWLEDFGRVLVVYRDPMRQLHGLDRFAYITQYEDGLKIDFTLWSEAIPARIAAAGALTDDLDVGYAVLLDKDGLTRGLAAPTHRAHVPLRPCEAEYLTLVEELFHEATYVAKNLWRDELLPAKYSLDQVMKQVDLRKMLEWLIETEHGWALKPGTYGKGLKKRLAPELWAELERTYVGSSLAENWEAMFATIDLFRKAAVEVGARLGFAYPRELDRRAVAYLRRVRALPIGS
jgi:aminoglycoside 6-adenylyltransferase